MSDEFDPSDVDETEAAETASAQIPAPRENPLLVGQEAGEAALLQAYSSGRLPHAWLITGPRGIGKATLAFRFARFLFSQGSGGGLFAAPATSLALDPADPSFRRVASGGHADLLVVERGYDPKRKRRRSEIVVDDVRAIADFMHLTAAEGGWRIIIVDGADEMNRNAANALLKVLEEPSQKAILLILSTSPGALLPTIRSRCRFLPLKLLSEQQVTDLLVKYRPDLPSGEVAALARLAEGSIGRAIELAEAGGIKLYRNLLGLLEHLPSLDGPALHAFADRLARADGEDSFRLVTELLPSWLAHMVVFGARGADAAGTVFPEEPAIMKRLAARRGLDQWVEVWEKLNRLFTLVDSVNLDRKQTVLNAFFTLEEATR
jgi:DNA polymerase-3 subunit delta'